MNFAELNALAADLRSSLRTFVGDDALVEVTVRPPAGDSDEASFLRLVAWSYILLFEAGRIVFPYLMKLPTASQDLRGNIAESKILVQELRTWSSHNLGFDTERGIQISRRVQRWFVGTCGNNPPLTSGCWQKCCHQLCIATASVVTHCSGAVTLVLRAEDGGDEAISSLQRRLNRVWPAHEFDKIVGDAATRLGVSVDPRAFREPRLNKWRNLLESLPEGEDLERQITGVIEQELLDRTKYAMPIDGRDVMEHLGLSPGPDVRDALGRAQELFRSGITERDALLAALSSATGSGSNAAPVRL